MDVLHPVPLASTQTLASCSFPVQLSRLYLAWQQTGDSPLPPGKNAKLKAYYNGEKRTIKLITIREKRGFTLQLGTVLEQ